MGGMSPGKIKNVFLGDHQGWMQHIWMAERENVLSNVEFLSTFRI